MLIMSLDLKPIPTLDIFHTSQMKWSSDYKVLLRALVIPVMAFKIGAVSVLYQND